MYRDEFTGNQYTAVRELATVVSVRLPGSWLPAAPCNLALDTRQWSTRAARGQSWQAHDSARTSKLAH